MEWLIVLALLGLAAGLVAGYLLARRAGAGGQRLRELEEQLDASRQELEDYRHEVVTQFSETARKFQTLNDSYTDLHQQLAKSSSILCGELTGPLLAAPAGHQDLLPPAVRETPEQAHNGSMAPAAVTPDEPAAPEPAPVSATAAATDEEEPPTLRERVERAMPAHTAASATEPGGAPDSAAATPPPAASRDVVGTDIRVAEPGTGGTAAPFRPGPEDAGQATTNRGADAEPVAETAAEADATASTPAEASTSAQADTEATATTGTDRNPPADRRAAG